MSQQLFVGRLPLGTKQRDLEDIFYRYGRMTRCDVKHGMKMSYGFVEYEDERDAKDAMASEQGRDINGSKIVVEWSRGFKNRDEYRPRDRYHDDYYRDDRDHRDRDHYSSRSSYSDRRSPRGDRGYRGRSPDHYSSSSRSYRDRSPDHYYSRESRRSRSRSRDRY